MLNYGHFAYATLRLLDSSPTIWTFHLQGQICEFLVSLRLLFEVWRVKSMRLTSDQSTLCMEYLLIFHIINYGICSILAKT